VRVPGFIGDVIEFLDRQGIDIGPQTDGGSVLRPPDDIDRAGDVVEQLNFTIILFENFGDSLRGALLLVGNLRVHVKVPARVGEPPMKLRTIFFHIYLPLKSGFPFFPISLSGAAELLPLVQKKLIRSEAD